MRRIIKMIVSIAVSWTFSENANKRKCKSITSVWLRETVKQLAQSAVPSVSSPELVAALIGARSKAEQNVLNLSRMNKWHSSSSHTTSDGIHTNAIDFHIPSNASKHVGTVTALIGISVRRMHLAERETTYVRNSFYHLYIGAHLWAYPALVYVCV